MRRVFNGQSNASRAAARKIYVDLDACIGQRESPTPHNCLARRHFDRWGRDAGRARAAMQRYASEGKIGRTQNKTIGFDRYEFSDGSLLVFSPNSAYVVDVNCSMSLRAFLQRLAPNYAAEEAHFIEIKRALREGWSGKG